MSKRNRLAKRVPLQNYWKLLKRYLTHQWPSIILLILLLFSMLALQLINPLILRFFIDSALAGKHLDTLSVLALIFISIALLSRLISVAETYVAENVAWKATNALRRDLALHCLHLDMSFHNTYTPGELIERIDGDITILANFFSRFVIQLIGNALLLIGVLLLLFAIDWRAGGILVIFTILAVCLLGSIPAFSHKYWSAERQNDALFFGFVGEQIAGAEDIRANGAIPFVMRSFYSALRNWFPTLRNAKLVNYFIWNTSTVVFALGNAASLGIGAYLHSVSGSITIGTVYLIFQYNQLLNQPIGQLQTQIQDLQGVGVSIERVQQLFSLTSSIQDGQERLPQEAPSIQFKNISFAYVPGVPVLQNVSFLLQPGRVLGVIGRTGSGKTTISRLLMRQYEASAGQIYLGAHDISTLCLSDIRQKVAVVTQEVQLFHASVRDNLTFFDVSISNEQIEQVLCTIGLDQWYKALPHGLDTLLASHSTLSAGEAQLLAFARVFLRNPVLICLDEASSRLDPTTERLIQKAIHTLLDKRTAIIIAHHLTTLEYVDDILILEDGYIREYGKREHLANDPLSHFYHLLHTEQGFIAT